MTAADGQAAANIRVFQGEDDDTRHNTLVGQFMIEGLADVHAGNQIVVRLDLDLDGILKVTATERATGLARQVTIDNATERFRKTQRTDAVDRIEAAFRTMEGRDDQPLTIDVTPPSVDGDLPPDVRDATQAARDLITKANRLIPDANPDDASELSAMLTDLEAAIDRRFGRRDPPDLGRGRGSRLLPGRRLKWRTPIPFTSRPYAARPAGPRNPGRTAADAARATSACSASSPKSMNEPGASASNPSAWADLPRPGTRRDVASRSLPMKDPAGCWPWSRCSPRTGPPRPGSPGRSRPERAGSSRTPLLSGARSRSQSQSTPVRLTSDRVVHRGPRVTGGLPASARRRHLP